MTRLSLLSSLLLLALGVASSTDLHVNNHLKHDQACAQALKSRVFREGGVPDTGINEPIANQVVTYVGSVGVGTLPTNHDLLVDRGSSNTWIGSGGAANHASPTTQMWDPTLFPPIHRETSLIDSVKHTDPHPVSLPASAPSNGSRTPTNVHLKEQGMAKVAGGKDVVDNERDFKCLTNALPSVLLSPPCPGRTALTPLDLYIWTENAFMLIDQVEKMGCGINEFYLSRRSGIRPPAYMQSGKEATPWFGWLSKDGSLVTTKDRDKGLLHSIPSLVVALEDNCFESKFEKSSLGPLIGQDLTHQLISFRRSNPCCSCNGKMLDTKSGQIFEIWFTPDKIQTDFAKIGMDKNLKIIDFSIYHLAVPTSGYLKGLNFLHKSLSSYLLMPTRKLTAGDLQTSILCVADVSQVYRKLNTSVSPVECLGWQEESGSEREKRNGVERDEYMQLQGS
ncbi:aspartic peptidase-like domain [Laccaria bicolor S238N-H82]|uniref:Aspartic peptidase-like domain n=1 Tax=Laccaria bicolor (strain S238N-H82 / ATCC MYA-4686) TaxID=486041 RepID=B0CPV3_LACBS|nr:aspartic peptidase-like domain [Laccaria bicolor S238N-H82]EDR16126.1 aspartic peptidase-like domain [Laccaria bicolor S238N-H82]|eukprot:XP_001874334.1 aspartic peptidase-like domain [Laccaria bicolor S238N-H82]